MILQEGHLAAVKPEDIGLQLSADMRKTVLIAMRAGQAPPLWTSKILLGKLDQRHSDLPAIKPLGNCGVV